MECKHENKKLIDYDAIIGIFGCELHTSTFKCDDCQEIFKVLGAPIIYSYPPKTTFYKGYLLPVEDVEILNRKYEEVERNKVGD